MNIIGRLSNKGFTSLQAFQGIFNTKRTSKIYNPAVSGNRLGPQASALRGLRSSGRPPRRLLGGRSSRRAGGRLRCRPQTLTKNCRCNCSWFNIVQNHTSQIFQEKKRRMARHLLLHAHLVARHHAPSDHRHAPHGPSGDARHENLQHC